VTVDLDEYPNIRRLEQQLSEDESAAEFDESLGACWIASSGICRRPDGRVGRRRRLRCPAEPAPSWGISMVVGSR
jgi:hypothetical protein